MNPVLGRKFTRNEERTKAKATVLSRHQRLTTRPNAIRRKRTGDESGLTPPRYRWQKPSAALYLLRHRGPVATHHLRQRDEHGACPRHRASTRTRHPHRSLIQSRATASPGTRTHARFRRSITRTDTPTGACPKCTRRSPAFADGRLADWHRASDANFRWLAKHRSRFPAGTVTSY
ncbi:MAG: hypothetical protein M2R45_03241 [Verrucomicrobia subdivision 3 bacterium]|nr:hypothetical protein [Limisphaerales bacterium]MCS1416102.1 hypothetical protein [Limisphaerales bacterium]